MPHKKIIWYISISSPVLFSLVVILLGFVIPGYDHFRDTISLLSITPLGWLQQINFLILGIGIIASSILVSQSFSNPSSKRIWSKIIIWCLIFLLVEISFPANDTSHLSFSLSNYSFSGLIHIIALALFFLFAPVGLYYLTKAFRDDNVFQRFSSYTAISGIILSFLCYLWTWLLISGNVYSFLGIFQKLIISILFIWWLRLIWSIRNQ